MQSNRLRILLVDDEQDVVTTLQEGLTYFGFKVDAFTNPEEALSEFKAGTYDAAVLDIRMPKISGFELARKLWEQDPRIQICFLTAFEIYEAEAHRVFPTMKSITFIKKPVAPSTLAKHIQSRFVEAT